MVVVTVVVVRIVLRVLIAPQRWATTALNACCQRVAARSVSVLRGADRQEGMGVTVPVAEQCLSVPVGFLSADTVTNSWTDFPSEPMIV